jgi:hypothetical protein
MIGQNSPIVNLRSSGFAVLVRLGVDLLHARFTPILMV